MLAMSCSRNRDLKCSRICKLPASSSCLGTFMIPILPFKLPIFTLSSKRNKWSGYARLRFVNYCYKGLKPHRCPK